MIHGSDFHLMGDEDIRCVHGETAETPRGYPVLTVMPPGRLTGGLTIWPGLDGLRRLRAAIDGYLAEHDAGRKDIPDRPVPAEAATADD